MYIMVVTLSVPVVGHWLPMASITATEKGGSFTVIKAPNYKDIEDARLLLKIAFGNKIGTGTIVKG